VIITGVGGQGNVLASKLLGNMLSLKGLYVTIGETFGASQRGGSVMSHLRISERPDWSPQIPGGKAHLVVALEPTEALRVLSVYGNRDVLVIANTRPAYPVQVISGELTYPSEEEIRSWLGELSRRCWFLKATEEAAGLGNAVLSNIILLGALSAIGVLPLERQDLQQVLERSMEAVKVNLNLLAYDKGSRMIRP
jgi:indolepyruvate ferredoxin oxidoreductase beta subunit